MLIPKITPQKAKNALQFSKNIFTCGGVKALLCLACFLRSEFQMIIRTLHQNCLDKSLLPKLKLNQTKNLKLLIQSRKIKSKTCFTYTAIYEFLTIIFSVFSFSFSMFHLGDTEPDFAIALARPETNAICIISSSFH